MAVFSQTKLRHWQRIVTLTDNLQIISLLFLRYYLVADDAELVYNIMKCPHQHQVKLALITSQVLLIGEEEGEPEE